jgi:lysophospholipase
LGAEEKVVDPLPIHDRMARWPKGKLVLVPNAEHEIMMEIPSTRQQFFEMTTELFQKNT